MEALHATLTCASLSAKAVIRQRASRKHLRFAGLGPKAGCQRVFRSCCGQRRRLERPDFPWISWLSPFHPLDNPTPPMP